jgi:Reverse transcriptase (RNA-dependent DNA polymerase)/Endonuclease-reverse transcriptase
MLQSADQIQFHQDPGQDAKEDPNVLDRNRLFPDCLFQDIGPALRIMQLNVEGLSAAKSYIGDFNSHHPDWGYDTNDSDGNQLQGWAAGGNLHLIHDSKQQGTFHSARWQKDYSPDLCWVSSSDGHPQPAVPKILGSFPHSQHRPMLVHAGLRLPMITGEQKPRWNFRKADWESFSASLERSIPCIPVRKLTVEEAFSRFYSAVRKSALKSIPRGFRPSYIPCMDSECVELLEQYEATNDSSIADHLIDCLNIARSQRWEESVSKLDFTRSSRKSWSLIRRLGEAEQPPKQTHAAVSANSVASHLAKIGKASGNKRFEHKVRHEWRSYCRSSNSAASPSPFLASEVQSAIQQLKTGTAAGYDNIHPEFLTHMGPKAVHWMSVFFSKVVIDGKLPKIGRKAKVIAIGKPGKDLNMPSNYRPISLLSVCYKLLERLTLQRISPLVEQILSPDQAGFRKERSTCDQVAALTTYIENGFQKNLKTGAVFLDLTAAYDTIWHSGLLAKLSKCMPFWFVKLVELLLRDRRFRVHLGHDTSRWKAQLNGLPQGSVLAPILFNLYTNDLPTTNSRKFAYADDICCGTQARTFAEVENTLSTDMDRITEYCHTWHLKPSAAKTVSSVFHLHNASANQELKIKMDGKILQHEPHPVYLGVTLDRTLSYSEHLSKTASKLKTRNNLLSKLAGSTWGASASTLRTSALALCYSVAEYCAPVWARSSHTHQIDVQLNSSMRTITGTIRSCPLPWLPVLSNIAPPDLRRKASSDKLVAKALMHPEWGLHQDLTFHPPPRLKSRHPLWEDLVPLDTTTRWRETWRMSGVVNAFLVADPAARQPGFTLPRHLWSLLNRFRSDHGPCRVSLKKWGLSNNDLCDCGEPQTMSHIVDSCPITRLTGGISALHKADDISIDWLTTYGICIR